MADPLSSVRIVVQPGFSGGRPMLTAGCFSVAFIYSRFLAGETREELAEDYDLTPEDIDAVVEFSRWCRRRGRYDAPYAERLARSEVGGWPRQVWPRRER